MSTPPSTQLTLPELADALESFKTQEVQLYLITRRQKADLPKRSKDFDRYTFTPYLVDASDELSDYLLQRVNEEMQTVLKKDRQLVSFDVTPDEADLDHVLACSRRSGDIGGFQHLLDALNVGVDNRQLMQADLSEVLDDVWAYCIRFQPTDLKHPAAYCFQRFSPSKVVKPETATLRTLYISTTNVVELSSSPKT